MCMYNVSKDEHHQFNSIQFISDMYMLTNMHYLHKELLIAIYVHIHEPRSHREPEGCIFLLSIDINVAVYR